ncbi:MAG: D-alanine--D-alanine ligase [Tannerellaceae bacterium]|nr:D-alanine--D-alanine ligase [Tannerellaceae bacterium]
MKKKNIAIIAGGDSSEYTVSLKSAEGILSFIDKEHYNVYLVLIRKQDWRVVLSGTEDESVPIDRNTFGFSKDGRYVQFDFAYITIHGTPGENGLLQGYFELTGIPYSSCGVLASALTFNKYNCNAFLRSFGILTASSILLRKGDTLPSEEDIVARLGLPLFVKPNEGGSSFGTTKVKTAAEIRPAICRALEEVGNGALLESFVDGHEVTCGCYRVRKETVIFPLTEVVTTNEFFDYDAKYNGQVEEITPARIPEPIADAIRRCTSRIYDLIGAHGIIRVDYIIPKTSPDTFCLLEVNTTPGMTPTSFIPQQVRAAGMNMKDVLTDIIESSYV